jgi:hypothetical protein
VRVWIRLISIDVAGIFGDTVGGGPMRLREGEMKQSCVLGIPVLALAVCAAHPAPAENPAGSPTNTTTYYDGAYSGTSIRTSPGPTNEPCPNIPVAPALHIQNGAAEFRALNLTFHGYVTPDGKLSMVSEGGQTFQGQFVGTGQTRGLVGRIIGRCIYDATWGKG